MTGTLAEIGVHINKAGQAVLASNLRHFIERPQGPPTPTQQTSYAEVVGSSTQDFEMIARGEAKVCTCSSNVSTDKSSTGVERASTSRHGNMQLNSVSGTGILHHNLQDQSHELNKSNIKQLEGGSVPPLQTGALKFAHLNIHSLVAKIDELRLLLRNASFDVIGLNETFCDLHD